MNEPHCSLDCGPITINIKNSNPKPNHILTMAEFSIGFRRYSEIICSVFPSRCKELNDFLSSIAELNRPVESMSLLGSSWAELYKVFLGCWSVSCVLCNSVTHEPSSCPLFNPAFPSNPDTNPGLSQLINSTYYVIQSKCNSKDDIYVISLLELMLAPSSENSNEEFKNDLSSPTFVSSLGHELANLHNIYFQVSRKVLIQVWKAYLLLALFTKTYSLR